MKTQSDIEGDFYTLLRESPVASLISGDVYRATYRPKDSRLEDAVVIVTATQTGQVQTGVVTINVYVPDTPDATGDLVKDGERCATLERALQDWVDTSLTAARSSYRIEQQGAVSSVSAEPDNLPMHFVVAMLRYDYFGDDSPVTPIKNL